MAMPRAANSREPNVWLLAGGRDKGFDFHDAGPVDFAAREGRIFVWRDGAKKFARAWSLFTPCSLAATLLEAVPAAAQRAVPGDVVLLSPACSSFDQFRNYQHRGEVFRQAVRELERSGLKNRAGAAAMRRDAPLAPTI